MTYTVDQFIPDFITTWEGGLSLRASDHGNYYKGKLIGSNFGVTGDALAAHRGHDVTADDIKNLTLKEASDIAKSLYFDAPGLDDLPWNQVTASVFDFGWGAGPVTAKKHLQSMIGAEADGKVGPGTVGAFNKFLALHGIEDFARRWAEERNEFYKGLHQDEYLHGWMNRSNGYLPGTSWWKKW